MHQKKTSLACSFASAQLPTDFDFGMHILKIPRTRVHHVNGLSTLFFKFPNYYLLSTLLFDSFMLNLFHLLYNLYLCKFQSAASKVKTTSLGHILSRSVPCTSCPKRRKIGPRLHKHGWNNQPCTCKKILESRFYSMKILYLPRNNLLPSHVFLNSCHYSSTEFEVLQKKPFLRVDNFSTFG